MERERGERERWRERREREEEGEGARERERKGPVAASARRRMPAARDDSPPVFPGQAVRKVTRIRRQAFSHGPKVGLKDKMGDVLRAALALIDSDNDGALTRDDIRVFVAKARFRKCYEY